MNENKTIFLRKLVKEMKKKEIYFREMTTNDLKEVVNSYIQVFSAEPWNDQLTQEQIIEYVNRMMRLNTFKGYIVRETGTTKLLGAALGFVRPWYKGEEYHLDTFYISNDYQSKGIGTLFLAFIKEQLKTLTVSTILLDTDRGYPAESFYLANGFSSLDSSITLFSSTDKN